MFSDKLELLNESKTQIEELSLRERFGDEP